MRKLPALLLAGTALSLLAFPATAATTLRTSQAPLVLAQADTSDPAVLAAEQAVEEARAALRDAMANGGDVKGARRALNRALKNLNEARVAAGLPPLGDGDTAEQAPAGGGEAPAATTEAPPADQPPAMTEGEGEPQKPFRKGKKPPAQAEDDSPMGAPEAETTDAPPADQPPATADAPAGQPPATADAPAEQAPAAVTEEGEPQKPFRKGKKRPVQAEDDSPMGAPEAVTESPADQPEGQPFRRKKPRFGEGAPPAKEGPPPQFTTEEGKPPVKTGSDIKEGQAVEASDGRVIVKEGGKLTIRSDDDARFTREGKVKTENTRDGGTITTVTRRNGVQVVTVRDRDGNIIQRFRRMPDGQVEVLIGAFEGGPSGGVEGPKFPKRPKFRPGKGAPPIGAGGDFRFEVYLPPVTVEIPEDDYIVESRRASRRQIQEALEAEPVEVVERPYSLEEIRRSERLRQKVRRIDIDTITFEFGSAEVPDDQVPALQQIGEALQRIISRDPNEVYLIEGHTDAVGSDLANLALSDRRAESVAEILTYYFEIPPENLITQGYGEAYLKVPTLAPERENRRVTMRRITPLLGGDQYSAQ